jgi:hypothetical protein
VTGGLGSLLVFPFNVKWRFSAPPGGMEGSKLCLFSVIMPAKCVSGVSPRFHYRRLAFCFLPLAAILESLKLLLKGNPFQKYVPSGNFSNLFFLFFSFHFFTFHGGGDATWSFSAARQVFYH